MIESIPPPSGPPPAETGPLPQPRPEPASKQIPNWFFMLMIVMFGITTLILAASVARTSDKTALGGLVGSTATFCLLIGKFFRYKNLERLHHNFVTTEDPKKRAAIKELIQNQGTPRKNRRGKRRKLEEDEEEPT